MRQSIELSSCRLSLRHDPLRLPTRQFSLRYPDFEDKYDFTTLFNDVFWSEDNTHLILIGPPLLNLIEDLAARFIALPQGIECQPKHQRKLWMDQISLPVPAGTTGLAIECATVRFVVAPQPNLCSLFEARRVIFAQSKNNDLEWIRDWARFYAREHGCDGVILYDNNSDRYALGDIDAALRTADEGLQVAVVGWPFPYGVFDGRRELGYILWDSFYSQATIFEHARRRFLVRARSVINADIDELALIEPSRSIFEIVEQSQTGMIRYSGWWIENQFPSQRPDRRHRDYFFRKTVPVERTDYKWAVVPARCPDLAQWCTHNVSGMPPDATSSDVHLRHIRAINTNWDVHRLLSDEVRTSGYAGDEAGLEADIALQRSFQRVFADDPAAEGVPADDRPVSIKAHALRVLAGRAKGAGSQESAMALAAEAHRLLPDHPGLVDYLADLLREQGESERAELLEAEARHLRETSPAYHLQMARAALARDVVATGIDHLRKVIEIDPGFIEACEHLIAHSDLDGVGGPLRTMVETCLQAVRSDDHLSLATAAGLCLQAGMPAEALAAVERAIAMEPHWSYHQMRARILTASGDTAAAITAWQAAIAGGKQARPHRPYPDHRISQILPTRLGAQLLPAQQYDALAALLLRAGRGAEAERVAEEGVQVDPASAHNWLLLSQALAFNDKTSQAAEALSRCRGLVARSLAQAKIFKTSDKQWIRLIDLMLLGGGHDEAAAEIAVARQTGITSWQLEQIAGRLAVERNDPHEAAQCLRRAIALNPDHAGLYSQLARILTGEKKWREVADTWAALTEVAPDNATAYSQLGMALARVGDIDEALAAMKRAIGLKGDEAEWYVNSGALLVRQKDWPAATAALRRAVELDPRHARAHRILHEALDGQGDIEQAMVAIRRAIDLDGGNASWHYELGALLARQGQWPAAAAACHRAIELAPGMARAGRLLEDCRRHE